MIEASAYSFYGLKRRPFGPAAPLVGLNSRAQLVGTIVDEMAAGRSVVTIRGERGAGKTTLAQMLAAQLQQNYFFVIQVPSASSRPLQVQKVVDDALGTNTLNASDPQTLSQIMRDKGIVVLIFDDASGLPRATAFYLWHLLKLLNFGETNFYVVLIGGMGPWTGFEHPDLSELRRMTQSSLLKPLGDEEARFYLHERMQAAGRPLRKLMTTAAAAELLDQAYGTPAQIDATLDRILARGYAKRERRIGRSTVREAFDEPGSFGDAPAGTWSGQRLVGWRTAAGAALVLAGVAGMPLEVSRRGPADDGGPQPVPTIMADITPAPPQAAPDEQAPSAAGAMPDAAEPTVQAAAPTPQDEPAVSSPADKPRSGGPGLALMAAKGDTLVSLYAKVYQGTTPPPFDQVVAINRVSVRPGTIVVFPRTSRRMGTAVTPSVLASPR